MMMEQRDRRKHSGQKLLYSTPLRLTENVKDQGVSER